MRAAARRLWSLSDPVVKCDGVLALWEDLRDLAGPDRARGLCANVERPGGPAWSERAGATDPGLDPPESGPRTLDDAPAPDLAIEPGRPARPVLVAPQRVPKRAGSGARARAGLLHAIAHIEFNAINLALDAVWRYPAMPADFALDWLAVAADECRHFGLVRDLLVARGVDYGDFDAHDGLWQMAVRTRTDLLARMALVPRVLEARGLDATPQIQQRLRRDGDEAAVAVLQVILDDEIGHVRIGDRWFRRLALERGLEPEAAYRHLIAEHGAPRPRGPINREARTAAGFSDAELDWLAGD